MRKFAFQKTNVLMFAAVFMGPFFVGCHPIEEKKSVLPVTIDSEGLAESYLVADDGCQLQADTEVRLSRGKLWIWSAETSSSLAEMSLAGLKSDVSLSSSSVNTTWFGLHQRTTCLEGEKCGEPEVVTAARMLRVCTPEPAFSRSSVESVSLASIHSLDAARAWYVKTTGADLDIARAGLVVLPRVESVTTDAAGQLVTREIDTDNLAFVESFGGAPAFIVYPRGKLLAAAGMWPGVNLWEIPWVLGHEFGHHVFRTHLGTLPLATSRSTAQNTLDGAHDFSPPPLFDRRGSGADAPGSDRTVRLTDHVQVVNEAFADLFSWYAHGARERSLRGLDCFDETREPDVATFKGGRPKKLDSATLAIWNSNKTTVRAPRCEAPNLQGPHDMGGLVAHGINRVFTAAGVVDLSARTALLLDWAKGVGRLVRSNRDATLPDLISVAVGAVATPDGKLSAAVCAEVRSVFSAFAEGILDGSPYQCL
jgi:hypothetical protein